MKKTSKYYIILIVITLILLFLYLIQYFKYSEKFSNYEYFDNKNMTFYRCKDKSLGKIIQNIFDNNNIVQVNDNWNIYIPCGYNNVEEELKQILIKKDADIKYIFGLNGCDSIVSKNMIWESLVKCFGRTYASTLMPESYVLGDRNEMEQFRKNFNPSVNDIYILKKNVQRKEGLKLTRDYFEILEASADNYRVVQKYITDLYLIKDRKVNLRIYLFIMIKDKIVYFYLCKNGKCIYTNKKYNDDDLDFESNITSYNLDMTVYKENPRDFDQLKMYIDIKEGVKGKSDLLFNNIELLMRQVSQCLSSNFYQSNNIEGTVTFQLFGADVIFDSKLHPYLLEFNKGPDMSARDDIDEKMKESVQSDMFKTIGVLEGGDDNKNSFYLIYKNNL